MWVVPIAQYNQFDVQKRRWKAYAIKMNLKARFTEAMTEINIITID